MLFKSNVLALVGDKKNIRYPSTKVIIWDDYTNSLALELSFKSPVLNVKLHKDIIVVATESNVFVYALNGYNLIDAITTYNNPLGTVAVSCCKDSKVLACPHIKEGHVRIQHYGLCYSLSIDQKRTNIFKTNKRAIACMSLNYSGSLLAVASIRGTKIKIFNTRTSEKLQELRRGSKNAEILCITFHRSSMFLACTSSKDAVHIFELYDSIKTINESEYKDYVKNTPPDEIGYKNNVIKLNPSVRNQSAKLAAVGGLLSNYFHSHWSFSRLKLNDAGKICGFADGNHFVGTLLS